MQTPEYVIRPQPQDLVHTVEDAVPGCTALFGECGWLPTALDRIVPISQFFVVRRGERRGWNPMFYPTSGHGIEPDYLAPVLRTSANVNHLVAQPDADGFCCGKSVEALRAMGHNGALRWIRRFERARNQKGHPLPDVLARAGHYWYEMKPDRQADFVTSINPDERLFVARMTPRSFVDQRLIALTARSDALDGDLAHALMNSTLTMFLIEAAGFGRRLSALDLSKNRVAAVLRIPDPTRIGRENRDRIVTAFRPMLDRCVLPVPDELDSGDRRELDEAILGTLGLAAHADAIRASLLTLYGIRKAVKERS